MTPDEMFEEFQECIGDAHARLYMVKGWADAILDRYLSDYTAQVIHTLKNIEILGTVLRDHANHYEECVNDFRTILERNGIETKWSVKETGEPGFVEFNEE